MTITSPACTSSTFPSGPPKATRARPRATPSTSWAVLWKWWKWKIPSRHALLQPLAAKRRSIASALADSAAR